MRRKEIINSESMLEFYRGLDIIDFKYKKALDGIKRKKGSVAEKALYGKLIDYESENRFSSLTKKNYEDAVANLNLVYDAGNQAWDNVELMDLIMDKVIGLYINIDGMERLFSDKFINFEWEMHLSADYKKHNMKFYRDHFIHQIRDAYTIHKILRQNDDMLLKSVQHVLMDESASKVSRYVTRCLKKQEHSYQNDLRREVLENDEDFYIRNLIFMSCYMAALFHDIGYPEAYFITSAKQIKEYIADLYNISDVNGNMSRIFALLQNSLLFRVVPFEEIEKRILKEKPEHGTLSAIVFLLHFYENGAIYRLPPYKNAAVELAALAIYNHTNKYAIIEKNWKNMDAFRPCFISNPISYLLRICDDLQEWDRIYFEISNGSNLLFCSKCNTPIQRELHMVRNGFRENERSRYHCNCEAVLSECDYGKQDMTCFYQAFDGPSKFKYRRIYNVTVCDSLELIVDKNKWKIRLNYDPYKLLHIAYMSITYAKYRVSELNSLKYLLECQDQFPHIFLEYFITSNVVHIKTQMIAEYLDMLDKNQKENGIKKQIQDLYKTGSCDSSVEEKSVIEDVKKEVRKKFDYQQNIIFEQLRMIIDEVYTNESLCGQCDLCRNFIETIPEIKFYDGKNSETAGSIPQKRLNRKIFSWNCLKGDISAAIEMPAELTEYQNKYKLATPDFSASLQGCNSNLFGKGNRPMVEEFKSLTEECPVLKIRRYIDKAIKLYIKLYLCQEIFKKLNINETVPYEEKEEKDLIWKQILSEIRDELQKQYCDYPELSWLIDDCFIQFQKMYEDIFQLDVYPTMYYKQFENGLHSEILDGNKSKFESKNYYYTAAAWYVDPVNYVPYLFRRKKDIYGDEDYIDAYTDLCFFQKLDNKMKENKGVV